MKKILKSSVVAGLMIATSVALASPVQFDITSASITPGSGYGVDSAENGGSLLDVRFSNSFSHQIFSLNSVGDSFSFMLSSVNFAEPNTGNGANQGISNNEQDNLGVTASFTFTNPLGVIANLTAQGTATRGSVSDPEVDYTLTWASLITDFGLGGQFEISLNNLSFSDIGTLTETATVTLLTSPRDAQIQQLATIPEPASLALLGLGLVGVGFSRRKK